MNAMKWEVFKGAEKLGAVVAKWDEGTVAVEGLRLLLVTEKVGEFTWKIATVEGVL